MGGGSYQEFFKLLRFLFRQTPHEFKHYNFLSYRLAVSVCQFGFIRNIAINVSRILITLFELIILLPNPSP